ncbi:MAG: hypothetical protein NC341_00165 [Blautia sp.]|nr:hypothetical protein [Blautia sp.]MCM1199824.1 hypothetical protein [Bacteroides fragilis]
MDFNQMPLEAGYAFAADRMASDNFSNLSDDEKREYIERNRSNLSDRELERMTSSLQEEEENIHFEDPTSLFRGPSIG